MQWYQNLQTHTHFIYKAMTVRGMGNDTQHLPLSRQLPIPPFTETHEPSHTNQTYISHAHAPSSLLYTGLH